MKEIATTWYLLDNAQDIFNIHYLIPSYQPDNMKLKIKLFTDDNFCILNDQSCLNSSKAKIC